MTRRLALWLILAALPVTLSAQSAPPLEIKLRITQADKTDRKADTNFQMAATSGFSVVQTLGNYNLFTYSQIRKAWNSNVPGDMYDLVNNPGPQDTTLCDQHKSPLQFDPRCGDNSWVVWKQPLSPSTGWNYFNTITGLTARVAAVPSIGVWPYQWPADHPKTGVPGQLTTLDAAKLNAAFPNPPKPSPHGCTREGFNPNYYATGAADTKVVVVNGQWYMAFNETINNPTSTGGWTSADIFRIGWATSTDGRSWIPRHILFRAPAEQNGVNCDGGFVLTQLFTDSGYFYMLVDEFTMGLILLRAPIQTNLPDGFSNWQVATNDSNHWANAPIDGVLDPVALNAKRLMQPLTTTYTQQGAIARVFSSSAPNSSSLFVAVTVDGTQLKLWSATSLDTLFESPFALRSSVDLAYLKPRNTSFGWELGFTYDANNTPATPTLIGNEFDFWLNGNFYPNGIENGTGISFTGYRTTATLSGDIYSPRGSLRSFSNYYLSAASDNSINAAPTSIGLNERWVLIDVNGGTLQANDVVNLQARNGLYVTNNGGATLAASQAYPSTNETFIIEKKNAGGATIVSGDLVALRSQSTSKYIIATAGGGSTVFSNGLDTNPNTRFTYTGN
ncbi:MAG TPA: hypothetical protein VGQ65_21980 [Thermoanaerobaculia bacterium]|jgi:hypothetical protein|nr:hypothetical protein [Thermoanaerobaculia bacterium]